MSKSRNGANIGRPRVTHALMRLRMRSTVSNNKPIVYMPTVVELAKKFPQMNALLQARLGR